MKAKTAILITLLLLCISCDSQGVTDEQFRHYFELPEFGQITPESAQAALSKKFPVGTPAKDIISIVERNEVGKDKSNQYFPLDKDGVMVCRVYRGTKSLIEKEYIIAFSFDRNRRLKNIEVKQSLTGM